MLLYDSSVTSARSLPVISFVRLLFACEASCEDTVERCLVCTVL